MSVSQKTMKSHQDLYKSKTPPWKETYRKRCLERLKQSREKLQARFRKLGPCDSNRMEDDNSFIKILMKEELEGLQRARKEDQEEDFCLKELPIDIDHVLSLFEDIQEELKREEMKLLEEFEKYEKSIEQEEASLCSAIENMSTEEVFCPVCQKHQLLQNKSVIFCPCGMRIDTEQDCLTLCNVKKLLEGSVAEHAEGCDGEASFSVVQDLGSNNLLMSCKLCDWMSIII